MQLDPISSNELFIKRDDFQLDKERLSHQTAQVLCSLFFLNQRGKGGLRCVRCQSTQQAETQNDLAGDCIRLTAKGLREQVGSLTPSLIRAKHKN